MTTLLIICALFCSLKLPQLSGKLADSAFFRIRAQKYFANHVFETREAESELECGMHCVEEESCASVNYKTSGIGKGRCELNRKNLLETFDGDELENTEYNHLIVVEGMNLQLEEPIESEENPHSCKEALKKNGKTVSGIYTLKSIASNQDYEVYCHMANITACGGGGWTLAMKIFGENNTFTYNSSLWTNNETYGTQDGLKGLTEKESKLASYWNTPFTKICLGMSYNGDRRWMTFDYTASSLYSVIADGQFRATTAGRKAWKSLIAGASLQYYCNKRGFNVLSRMRIGFFANNENDCKTCDSWIGFGTEIDGKTCGNYANSNWSPDNGGQNFVTFGYILVQ